MSPTGDDTPQQGGSLDGSQPDPKQFNPKEISVDKSVPWQKSDPPPFDEKDGLFKHNNQFGHEQNAGGGHELAHTVQQGGTTPPDSDGLPDPWEEKAQIDVNSDGVEQAGSHQYGGGGGEGKQHFHDLDLTKDPDHVLNPKSPNGPGDEINPGKYGRVKVQFFWDREGKKDSGEGGVNDMTHKRPAPIVLAIIAILLLMLGVGLITIFGGGQTAGGTDDGTATTSSINQLPTDEPTEAATHDTNQSSSTGGGGDQPTAVVTEPPPVFVATEPPAECAAGWLPVSGCTCCGTTLTCADGTIAEFNPQCGVGGSSGGGGCQCVCPVGNPNCIDSCTGAICTP